MEKLLDVSRRRRLQLAELEENLAALPPWNLREFEIPDVIAFKDFVHSRRSVAESLFAAQRTLTWGRALRFPYPNRDTNPCISSRTSATVCAWNTLTDAG